MKDDSLEVRVNLAAQTAPTLRAGLQISRVEPKGDSLLVGTELELLNCLNLWDDGCSGGRGGDGQDGSGNGGDKICKPSSRGWKWSKITFNDKSPKKKQNLWK